MQLQPQITLIELLVDDEEAEQTETFWVTERVYLRVPVDVERDVLEAIIEALCRC